MYQLTRKDRRVLHWSTHKGAEVANNAAEDDIEPRNVALEAESDAVNTDTEQDEQSDHEVVNSTR
jgi:hypothetical protein